MSLSLGSCDGVLYSSDSAHLVRIRGDVGYTQQAHIIECWDARARRCAGIADLGRHYWFRYPTWALGGSRFAAIMHVDGEQRVLPRVVIFEAPSMKLLAAIPLEGYTWADLCVSRDGSRLLALNGNARVIDLQTGSIIDSLCPDSTWAVRSGAFLPDGNPVLLVEDADGQRCCSMKGEPSLALPPTKQMWTTLQFSDDGTMVGRIDSSGVSVFDTRDGRLLQRVDTKHILQSWSRVGHCEAYVPRAAAAVPARTSPRASCLPSAAAVSLPPQNLRGKGA